MEWKNDLISLDFPLKKKILGYWKFVVDGAGLSLILKKEVYCWQ